MVSMRALGILGVMGTMVLAIGCTDAETSDDALTSLGEPTTNPPTSTSMPTNGTGNDGASTMDSGTQTPTTGAPTTDGSTSSAATTDTPTTDTPTTDTPTTDTSGNPGDGQLGECIGTGAWNNCAQYCSANLDVCVEAGCDGQTVVYYNDVGSCTDMEADGGEAIGCDEDFATGGGISFARCCCA